MFCELFLPPIYPRRDSAGRTARPVPPNPVIQMNIVRFPPMKFVFVLPPTKTGNLSNLPTERHGCPMPLADHHNGTSRPYPQDGPRLGAARRVDRRPSLQYGKNALRELSRAPSAPPRPAAPGRGSLCPQYSYRGFFL